MVIWLLASGVAALAGVAIEMRHEIPAATRSGVRSFMRAAPYERTRSDALQSGLLTYGWRGAWLIILRTVLEVTKILCFNRSDKDSFAWAASTSISCGPSSRWSSCAPALLDVPTKKPRWVPGLLLLV